jgi:2-polyprenyl-3-methyl-5-hydroxy-6-metoxy-1,4-benzoquinol methylase
MKEYFETNRKAWDLRVNVHRVSKMYDLDSFKNGRNSLTEIELNGIGKQLPSNKLLHLQCHFGQDSLSMTRMGAKVTGVDLSPKGIKLARELNAELGLDAIFVESNVLKLQDNLEGDFDIVFTSFGVTSWLPDLEKWAAVIDHFLKPGGTFFIAEFHPVLYMFDFRSQKIEFNYFNSGKAIMEEVSGTYTDRSADIRFKEYFWTHSLHETINPLVQRGFIIKEFIEYPYSPFNCFENMREIEKGKYKFSHLKSSIPHVFSLKMKKPL